MNFVLTRLGLCQISNKIDQEISFPLGASKLIMARRDLNLRLLLCERRKNTLVSFMPENIC